MAKLDIAKCKQCRRAGERLFLKGDRCATPKCAMVKKPYAPGMHGLKGQRGLSEFGKQLAEKQKVKRSYEISERQLRRHLREAQTRGGVTGDNLIIGLEMRLDNIIFRMGLASSRSRARQLVSHGMFLVNDKALDIPSAQIKVGSEVGVKKNKAEKKYFKERQLILKKKKDAPSWISFDAKTMKGKILSQPSVKEISIGYDLAAVIEFYSR